MSLIRYIEIVAVSIVCLLLSFSASSKETISEYTVNDGLSQHSVTSIVQDSRNMLWVGTFDGLNMFDGHDFTNFRHYSGDTASIPGNRVLALANDPREGLWILFANNYVGKYCGDGKFMNYKLRDSIPDLGNEIKVMKVLDGNIIIEDNNSGIVFFRPDSGRDDTDRMKNLKKFLRNRKLSSDRVKSVDFSGETIWVSTSEGIWYSVQNGRFEHVDNEYGGYSLKCSPKGYLLLYRNRTFIACSTVFSESGRMVLHEISRHEVPALIQDVSSGMNGEFWIGSRQGLYKSANDRLTAYPPDSPVRTLFLDNFGVLWSGGLNGLVSVNPYSAPVYNYRFDDALFSIDNHVSTLNVSEDDRELWVGIMQRGLHLMEPENTGEGEKSFVRREYFFQDSDISSVCLYSADTVIAGTDKGLKMLVRKNGIFRAESPDVKFMLNRQPFRSVMMDGKMYFSNGGCLRMLSFRHGTPVLDSLDWMNSILPRSSTVVALAAEPESSSLWIGYRGAGVYKVDIGNRSVCSLEQFTGCRLSNPYVWDIFFDSGNRLWIGTDAGLDMIAGNDSAFSLRTLSLEDGLKNDKIETIEEDSEGMIWTGTSQGIICYNPETGDFTSYGYEDGFQSNNFTSASASFSDGTLVFGGVAGFSWFNPCGFAEGTLAPSLFIEKVTAGSGIVDMSGNGIGKIRKEDSNVRIILSSYYSPNPGKIRYLYSINDSGWNEISENEIKLPDLAPGRYDISVKAVASPSSVSEARNISFVVRRPALLSVSAFFLYFLLFFLILFMSVRVVMARKILANRLKMEETLRQNESRMNMEKLNFYTNMAHEIKTPLSLILGRIYDIETSSEASPDIIGKARLIGDNAQIIKELTEQILEFKRVVSGRMALEIQETDIVPYVRTIVDNYMDYAEKRGIGLSLQTSADAIVCNMDMKKLIRIIYNLLSNAIKFSERGDSVEVKLVGKPDCLILTVSDTGSGIAEKDLPHIFERFYKSGKSGGSGIGLAFTKSLVELMNGEISVSSRVDEGSTFIVRIPEQKQSASTAGEDSRDSVSVLAGKEPVILLVEDNVELNDYIAEILSVQFRVLQAFDGKEAVGILQNRQIDLVLSDVMMPQLDGIELADKIKNIKQYAHIPLVFLSAKTDPDDQLAGLRTGAVDYITKPFNPHILLMKIRNILAQYYLSKENLASETAAPDSGNVPVRNKDEAFINKAREIIYSKMSDEEFSVAALSNEMGISRVHLTREFQRIIGKSPSAFIKGIRLNHARHLLASGNYSIKEVIWEIGIRSHSGFTKAYKEEFGYLPSQTRDSENMSNNTDN